MTTIPLAHVLYYVPALKPVMIKHFVAHYTLADLLKLSTRDLQQLAWPEPAIQYLLQQDWPEVAADINWAQQQDQRYILSLDSPHYPPLLKEIHDPPLVLFARGDTSLLLTPQIAIVGTRKPSPNGRQAAFEYGAALAQQGFTITSGLALGIDGASHSGCLSVQGKTIAVLGNGLEQVYPRNHTKLYEDIAAKGLLISEFPPHTPPIGKNFPKRNRIISGLSLAVLVVEAALQSGSSITARLANEQGREVFAMPGSIYNPQTRGCHALIKNGAKLVESVSDILEELQPLLETQLNLTHLAKNSNKSLIKLDKNQSNVLKYINFEPTSIENILAHSGMAYEVVLSALMQLELKGCIVTSLGSYTRVTGAEILLGDP